MKKKVSSRFLNLSNDLIFKAYFKSNKLVLKSLLKTFLPLPKGYEIQQVELLDSALPSAQAKDKQPVLDMRVQLNKGEVVNVEMQVASQEQFSRRILFYWSKLYTHSLKKGEDYKRLFPTYSLIFTCFNMFKGSEAFYNSFSIRSDQAPFFVLNEDLKIVIVELSKFLVGDVRNLLDLREEWCYMLNNSSEMTDKEAEFLSLRREDMKMATDHLMKLSRDEQLLMLEEQREKDRRDQVAREDYQFNRGIEKGIEEGRQEGMERGIEKGIEEGRQEGMERGIEKGIEEGRQEGMERGIEKGIEKNQQEVILNMLRKGTDISFISEVTGCSEEEVKKLQNSRCPSK